VKVLLLSKCDGEGGNTMSELLFDGKHDVNKDEVLKKMNYFIEAARQGMELYEEDKNACLEIAKKIRSELEKEYKNNNQKRIEDLYKDNKWFYSYSKAVHQAIASITGKMTNDNVFHFLYDVEDYMSSYLPKSDK
jgi:hypothetical protein